MVRPTYKDYWDIPGGYVEPSETPYQACVREVEEELGIRPTIGRLLVADWAPTERDGDKVLFIFDGGQLSKDQHVAIRLQDSELCEYRYVPLATAESLTSVRLIRRLKAAITAIDARQVLYLEHGESIKQATSP